MVPKYGTTSTLFSGKTENYFLGNIKTITEILRVTIDSQIDTVIIESESNTHSSQSESHMIPNIFISSTIKDLHYLRDSLRDTITELAYNPVMSEHSGVGYLNPVTAAESCYMSIRQCQMVVLIIGSRYGWKDDDGLSVTHREFKAAREASIPIITLVESRVLNYKEVYDSSRDSDVWDKFELMDDSKSIFEFLKEISELTSFNAIVPFITPTDAKNILKLQLAHKAWMPIASF